MWWKIKRRIFGKLDKFALWTFNKTEKLVDYLDDVMLFIKSINVICYWIATSIALIFIALLVAAILPLLFWSKIRKLTLDNFWESESTENHVNRQRVNWKKIGF